jgi:hypothetical protein
VTPDAGRVPIADRAAWRTAAWLVPLVFLLALAVHIFVLQRFPNSGDEYAYLWQATAFAEGSVTAPSPQPAEAFRLNHIGDLGGRRVGKYPPGWPLLLSLGVLLGAPGLMNPLLAALALAGIYRLGCSWIGPRAAGYGAVAVACSPFFLLNAGSWFSHPSCLFALTGLALAMAWAEERPGSVPFALAGSAFGLAVLIRPYTAILIGVPLVAVLGWRAIGNRAAGRTRGDAARAQGGPPFWKAAATAVMCFILGGVPMLAMLLGINRAATGNAFMLAWTAVDSSETLGLGVHGLTLWRGIKTTVRLIAEGMLYTGFALPVFAALAIGRSPTRHRWLLWLMLAAPVVGYAFWWSHGGNRYGPRFYFEALLPFTLLAGAGFERIVTWGRGRGAARRSRRWRTSRFSIGAACSGPSRPPGSAGPWC